MKKGAKAEAEKSDYIYRHGAISFLKGKPTGKGFNSTKIHGGLARDYGFVGGLHAEVSALKNVKNADTVLVVRVSRSGKLSMSAPCEKCLKFLRDKGIKKVYFSNWAGEIEEMRL